MSDKPWFKFYASDWLGGARALSLAERGLYMTLLAMMYDEQGPIRGTDERLARLCGCTTATFRKTLNSLIEAGKITEDDRGLSNNRAEKELKKISEKSQAQSFIAKTRWGKTQTKSMADECVGISPAMPTECLPEARIQKKESPLTPKGEEQGLFEEQLPEEPKAPEIDIEAKFEEFRKAYPRRDGADPRKPAWEKFQRLVKGGVDPDDIIRGASAYREQQIRLGKEGTQYVKQVQFWLNQEGWKDDYGPRAKQASAPASQPMRELPESQWRTYIDRFHAGLPWPEFCGPPPGQPGCRAPAALLEKLAPKERSEIRH